MKDKIKISPSNNEIISEKKPKITIEFLQRESFPLEKSKIRITLDNKKLKFKQNNNEIKCILKKNLKTGKHKLKVKISFKDKRSYEFNSNFIIEKDSSHNVYYGIPHCHTNYSTGKGSPAEACKTALKNKLDFIFITDHISTLNKDTTYKSKTKRKWDALVKLCEKSSIKNKFIALPGYEVKIKGQGHYNVIFISTLINNHYKNLSTLAKSAEKNNCIISINHPDKTILKFNNYNEFENTINLIEVGNGAPPFKYKRYDKTYFTLLDKGWHLAAINSQDNHDKNWGDKENLTAVITGDLSKSSLYNAFKKRQIYSTESRSLKLFVKANNHLMGSKINLDKSSEIEFNISAKDPLNKIYKIQLISNGGKIIKEQICTKNTIDWNFKTKSFANSWYVVRVILEADKRALSSAIFVE
ncbi:CehA/McbA family metallohydrolase [Clostridium sp. DL1XJH146]